VEHSPIAESTKPSNRDLVLLHLLQFNPVPPYVDAATAMTQGGARKILNMTRSSLSKWINILLKEKLIESESHRVEGETSRRQIYWLTPGGRIEAQAKKDQFMEKDVEVQTLEGNLIYCKLKEVNAALGLNLPLMTLITMSSARGPVQHSADHGRQTRFLPELSSQFVGRSDEIKTIIQWLETSTPCYLVTSMAGMGKTSVVRAVYEQLKESRTLLWFTLTGWDTPEVFLRTVSKLLTKLGKNSLQNEMNTLGRDYQESLNSQFMEIVVEDLTGSPPPLIILDDLHISTLKIRSFLLALMQYGHPLLGARWLVTSRDPNVLSEIQGRVEVDKMLLKGLNYAELGEMMPEAGDQELYHLWTQTRGHPLAAKLMATTSETQQEAEWERFVEHHIISDLNPKELKIAQMISLQPLPTPAPDILVADGMGMKEILSLIEKGLLIRAESGDLKLHDLLVTPISADLSQQEAHKLHQLQYLHFRKKKDDDSTLRTIHHLLGLNDSKNAIKTIARWGHELVDRGRSELFHLIEKVYFDEYNVHTDLIQLIKARIHLLWDEKEEAIQLMREVDRGSYDKLPNNVASLLLSTKAQFARESDDFNILQEVRDDIETLKDRGMESWGMAEAHNELGLTAKMEGDYNLARNHYKASLRMFEALEARGEGPRNSPGSVKPMANLARIKMDEGNIDGALSDLVKGVHRARERNAMVSEGRCLISISRMQRSHPEEITPDTKIPKAYQCLKMAILLFEKAGDRGGLCLALIEQTKMDIEHQDWEMASVAIEKASKLAKRIGSKFLIHETANLKTQVGLSG